MSCATRGCSELSGTMGMPWTSAKGRKPVLLEWRSSSVFIVTMASVAVFTDIFLYAVIVPVIPFSLSKRAAVAEDGVQYWVSILLAVYGGALLVGSPIWGFMADRTGNRRVPMLAGLVLLAGATLFLCLATNLAMLLAGRILQGLSAAMTWTVGLALVMDTVDSKRVGQATGWIGVATSVGLFISPVLGGWVYGKVGYYPVFAMCFGLIAVDIVLRLSIIEVKSAKKWLEVEGASPRTEESVVTAEATKAHQDQPVSSVQLQAEPNPDSTSTVPLGLRLLRNSRLLAALWGSVVLAVFATAFDSTLPLLLESTFGWNSIGAGLIYLPVTLPAFLSPLLGVLCDRYGAKWITTVGYLGATPFMVCLRFVQEDNTSHVVMLCGLLAAIGCCMACVFGPTMAEITWAIQPEDESDPAEVPYGLAYGLYNMAFSAGAMLGPLMGGMVRQSAGWGAVGWSLALLSFVTSITQAIWIGGPLKITWGRRRHWHRRPERGPEQSLQGSAA